MQRKITVSANFKYETLASSCFANFVFVSSADLTE